MAVSNNKVVSSLPNTLLADALYYVRVGDGFDVYLTSSGPSPVAYKINGAQTGARAKAQFCAVTDCVAAVSTDNWIFSVSGTGAAFSQLASTTNQVGVLRAALGTTATGRAAIISNSTGILRFGLGETYFYSRCSLVALSDAANTYSMRIGLIDSAVAESVDGAFFRYTNSVNGGKWQAVARNNNIETVVDCNILATAGTWNDFEVQGNSAGNSLLFLINNVVAATITTNIPTSIGREFGFGVMALRSVGTSAFNVFDCDLIETIVNFTNIR